MFFVQSLNVILINVNMFISQNAFKFSGGVNILFFLSLPHRQKRRQKVVAVVLGEGIGSIPGSTRYIFHQDDFEEKDD